MPASTYPEFNAAVTDLTTQVNTLLVDVAALQGVANVQVAVTKASAASASATVATSAKVTAVSAKTAAEAARDVATAARDTAVTAASAMTGNLVELGGIDLSGGSYPATPQFATFWKVTVAGVVGGIPYGVGDTLVYSKNINQFYKIDNTESVSSVNGQTGAVAVEPTIAAGTAAQMWLGNKTWASVLSQVQGVLLTGLSLATGTPITSTDSVLSSLGKLQKQITDAATDLAADVRAVALTGLSLTTGTAITATDSVLSGLGKLQKQITDAATDLAADVRAVVLTGYLVGTDTDVAATDTVLSSIQKLQGQVNARSLSTHTHSYLSLAGGTLTGDLVVQNLVSLKGLAEGAASVAYAAFVDSLGVRDGYVGCASSSTRNIYLTADAGDILIHPTLGRSLLYNAGTIKLATKSTGVSVTGDLEVSGVVSQVDSGWLTPTLVNSFVTGGNPIKYRKIGSTVYVTGSVTKAAAVAWGTIFSTLPVGYRPDKAIQIAAIKFADNLEWGLGDISIGTGGELQLGLLAGTSNTNGSWHMTASFEVA